MPKLNFSFKGNNTKSNSHSNLKAKNIRALIYTIRQLALSYKKYLKYVSFTILFATISTTFSLLAPGKISQIIELIRANFHDLNADILHSIAKLAIVIVIIYISSFVFSLMQSLIMSNTTQKILKSLRRDVSVKINKLPLKYFDQSSVGDVLSRITNDIDTLSHSLQQGLSMLFSIITMFVGSFLVMFVTNWVMAVSGVLATAVGLLISVCIVSFSQKYFKQQQSRLGQLNGHVEEYYSGHKIIKAYNAEEFAIAYFDKLNKTLFSSSWKAQFLSSITHPIMHLTGNLGYVSVSIVGFILVLKGYIGIETVVAFMIYIKLFTRSILHIASLFTSFQTAAAASERVFDFLNEEEIPIDEIDRTGQTQCNSIESFKGDIDFDHVNFGYMENKLIIKDFTAHVTHGQKVAIVGPTGSGKTTLINLLMRFYEIQDGAIRIDGIPINKLPRPYVRSLFAMVLQDTWLFEGTIMENLSYCRQNIDEEKVISVCKMVGIHHFIKTLPMGYNTVLNDNVSLSTGQKQLITIARAMLEDSPMLILDEATSSVDTRTEYLIQQAMDKLMENKTCFVIAHRLSTIRNADLILVMNNGSIVESGIHSELLEAKGLYADLYYSQFKS